MQKTGTTSNIRQKASAKANSHRPFCSIRGMPDPDSNVWRLMCKLVLLRDRRQAQLQPDVHNVLLKKNAMPVLRQDPGLQHIRGRAACQHRAPSCQARRHWGEGANAVAGWQKQWCK